MQKPIGRTFRDAQQEVARRTLGASVNALIGFGLGIAAGIRYGQTPQTTVALGAMTAISYAASNIVNRKAGLFARYEVTGLALGTMNASADHFDILQATIGFFVGAAAGAFIEKSKEMLIEKHAANKAYKRQLKERRRQEREAQRAETRRRVQAARDHTAG